jgi:hypothetical protein
MRKCADEVPPPRIFFILGANLAAAGRPVRVNDAEEKTLTEKGTGRPSAAKGGFVSPLTLDAPNPGASRRLCPGRYARALTDFVFEEIPR